jgi:hypothetical protein
MNITPNSQSSDSRDGVTASNNVQLNGNPQVHAPLAEAPATTSAVGQTPTVPMQNMKPTYPANTAALPAAAVAPHINSLPVSNGNVSSPPVTLNGSTAAPVVPKPIVGASQVGPNLALNGNPAAIAAAAPRAVAAAVPPTNIVGVSPAAALPLSSAGNTGKPMGTPTIPIAQGNLASNVMPHQRTVVPQAALQPQAVVPNPLASVPNPLAFGGPAPSVNPANIAKIPAPGVHQQVPVVATRTVPAAAAPVMRPVQPQAAVNQNQVQFRPNVVANPSIATGGTVAGASVPVRTQPTSGNLTQPSANYPSSVPPVQNVAQQQQSAQPAQLVQQIKPVSQVQQHVPVQPVRPQPRPAAAVAKAQPQAGPQPVMRRVVLSPEGRDALTKAVLSSLKDPNGVMDPSLLALAMRTTELTKDAILNAAKMARDRESEKKTAAAAAALSRAQAAAAQNLAPMAAAQIRAPAIATAPRTVSRPMPQAVHYPKTTQHQQIQHQQQQHHHQQQQQQQQLQQQQLQQQRQQQLHHQL